AAGVFASPCIILYTKSENLRLHRQVGQEVSTISGFVSIISLAFLKERLRAILGCLIKKSPPKPQQYSGFSSLLYLIFLISFKISSTSVSFFPAEFIWHGI